MTVRFVNLLFVNKVREIPTLNFEKINFEAKASKIIIGASIQVFI